MTPIKICKQEAEIIRDFVKAHLRFEPRHIGEALAAELRQMAENDEQEHMAKDPEYETGGGPANLINRVEPKVEKRQRMVGEWSESWRKMFGEQSGPAKQERLG